MCDWAFSKFHNPIITADLKVTTLKKLYVLFVLLYIIKQSKFDFLVLNMFKLNFLYDIFLLLAKCV